MLSRLNRGQIELLDHLVNVDLGPSSRRHAERNLTDRGRRVRHGQRTRRMASLFEHTE
jgi:hypothetical protein